MNYPPCTRLPICGARARIKLTQPNYAGAGAELGNKKDEKDKNVAKGGNYVNYVNDGNLCLIFNFSFRLESNPYVNNFTSTEIRCWNLPQVCHV